MCTYVYIYGIYTLKIHMSIYTYVYADIYFNKVISHGIIVLPPIHAQPNEILNVNHGRLSPNVLFGGYASISPTI